jgi:hypothetical protein
LPVECDGFLVEFLGVTDVAEGELIKRVFYGDGGVLLGWEAI